MAISTYKIFLMKKSTSAYEKLIDIKEFPDLGGAPEMLETTTLSDNMQTYIPGVQSLDALEFTANYTKGDFTKLKALEGQETDFAVWFGGTVEGGTLTPTGSDGKFEFKGQLSVFPVGGGVNEVVDMTVTIAKEINQMANYIYPVGSYYISHNRTSPAQLFGGTWLRVTDRFLWGCSSTETIGSTGGEKTHTLTTSEIPPHAHYLPNSNNAGETQNYTLTYNPNAKGLAGTLKTKNTGEGGAHNNMPPYVNVAIWRRIA